MGKPSRSRRAGAAAAPRRPARTWAVLLAAPRPRQTVMLFSCSSSWSMMNEKSVHLMRGSGCGRGSVV